MQGNQSTNVPQKRNLAVAKFEAVVKEGFINEQLSAALGENRGTFVTSLIELYTGDKSLQQCDPKRVALEAVKAASLNLPINKALGFAYIVVYNVNTKTTNPQTGRDEWVKTPTPTFVLGYKGYIQLASRTGQYRTINATPVYEGELKGIDRLTGTIDLNGHKTSDKVIGYVGYVEYLNGFSKSEYMSVEDMAKHALKNSPSLPRGIKLDDLIALANKSAEAKKVGWMGNFNDMAVKTILRRIISKYGYMTIQMQTAVTHDINSDISMSNEQRDEVIATTQTEVINLDETSYEELDAETGEVKNIQAQAEEAQPEADPGY